MKYTFDVAFLPCEALKKHDARIVVDLLRATTQITTFFDMGGEVLVPVTEVDEAFAMRDKLGEDWKIMGERGGLPARLRFWKLAARTSGRRRAGTRDNHDVERNARDNARR